MLEKGFGLVVDHFVKLNIGDVQLVRPNPKSFCVYNQIKDQQLTTSAENQLNTYCTFREELRKFVLLSRFLLPCTASFPIRMPLEVL